VRISAGQSRQAPFKRLSLFPFGLFGVAGQICGCAHKTPIQVVLKSGLVGPCTPQLFGPVGADNGQRNPRMVRLHNRRNILTQCRARSGVLLSTSQGWRQPACTPGRCSRLPGTDCPGYAWRPDDIWHTGTLCQASSDRRSTQAERAGLAEKDALGSHSVSAIVLLDTSIYLNVLDVPSRNQKREQILNEFEERVRCDDLFLLPMAA